MHMLTEPCISDELLMQLDPFGHPGGRRIGPSRVTMDEDGRCTIRRLHRWEGAGRRGAGGVGLPRGDLGIVRGVTVVFGPVGDLGIIEASTPARGGEEGTDGVAAGRQGEVAAMGAARRGMGQGRPRDAARGGEEGIIRRTGGRLGAAPRGGLRGGAWAVGGSTKLSDPVLACGGAVGGSTKLSG